MTSPDTPATSPAHLAGTWELDVDQTTVEFHTKAMWVIPVTGYVKAISGQGLIDERGHVSGTLVLDMSSIDTKNGKRNQHLKTADFFDVDNHPTMVFEASDAQVKAAGQAEVTGTLTIAGQTRPLTVPARFEATADAVTLDATFDLDRSQWGITWAKMGAGLHNRVSVHAHFHKQ